MGKVSASRAGVGARRDGPAGLVGAGASETMLGARLADLVRRGELRVTLGALTGEAGGASPLGRKGAGAPAASGASTEASDACLLREGTGTPSVVGSRDADRELTELSLAFEVRLRVDLRLRRSGDALGVRLVEPRG